MIELPRQHVEPEHILQNALPIFSPLTNVPLELITKNEMAILRLNTDGENVRSEEERVIRRCREIPTDSPFVFNEHSIATMIEFLSKSSIYKFSSQSCGKEYPEVNGLHVPAKPESERLRESQS